LLVETRKLAPTLVIDPGEELAIMREEIFGPVLPIKTYRGLDQAIDHVNGHPRPPALYYFGADPGKRDEVLRRTISGGAAINTTLFHFVAENLPFGASAHRGSAPIMASLASRPSRIAKVYSCKAVLTDRVSCSRRSDASPT